MTDSRTFGSSELLGFLKCHGFLCQKEAVTKTKKILSANNEAAGPEHDHLAEVWCSRVYYGIVWYGMVWYSTVQYGIFWQSMVEYSAI